jgi:L-ribulose-5-phosphate 3-epimerase
MLVSCLASAYRPHPAEDAIAGVRRAGLENIELGLRTTSPEGQFVEPPDEGTLARWEQILAEHSVRVPSVIIMSGDPADPARLEMALSKLVIGRRFGAKVAVAMAGEAHDERHRQTLYEHHRRLGDRAGELGMVVSFETHPGLCGDWRAMQRTMEDLDHPALRLNFDTANYAYYNDGAVGEIALLRVAYWVASLHLKDTTGEAGLWDFPALGDAAGVDFCRTLEILKGLRFEGPSTIEIDQPKKPALTLAQCQDRVERSVRHLRNCGWLDA